jgi:restriction endonuclease S subunit
MFYREDDAVERLELGIADISGWNAVHSGLEKVARLHPRRDLPTLQEGDVVLSVKGTIGKACLVGAVQPESVVVSQNCLGLRVKPSRRNLVSPQYLLMYLRSEAGQAQLQSLQDGANTQHISSQTLSNSFLVPVPEAQERAAVENDYLRLCQLEREIADIQQQMKEISIVRWLS